MLEILGNITVHEQMIIVNMNSYLKPYHHHHHHVVPLARIFLILSHHFSLSFIASGRSSGLHPVSSHSCWMYVRAGCPAFARSYVGVHRSTSLMSSSLLLQHLYDWSLTVRLFNVISRTIIEGVLLLCRDVVDVLYSPSRLGWTSTPLTVIVIN